MGDHVDNSDVEVNVNLEDWGSMLNHMTIDDNSDLEGLGMAGRYVLDAVRYYLLQQVEDR